MEDTSPVNSTTRLRTTKHLRKTPLLRRKNGNSAYMHCRSRIPGGA
jgi:hypothetical protein